jgi:hypothetical protein
MSWAQFLKLHWEVLAASDFFTVEVATWHGLVTYYVLVVMELATRRVQIAGITPHPTAAFMQQCARRVQREGESLGVLLDVQGVEATQNIAERAHRGGVVWRKSSQRTWSDKGNRWVERVLSLRHTCRIRGRPTFPLFVEAVSCLFKGEGPDLSWIPQHEPLPAPSTP